MSIIKIRKFAEKSKLTLFMTLLCTILSCSKDSINQPFSSVHQKSATASTSGEDIFRGFFFLEGDLSSNVSSLATLKQAHKEFIQKNPDYLPKYKEFNDKIVSNIKISYPTLMSEILTTVKSGSVYEIKEVFTKAGLITQQEILKLVGEKAARSSMKIFNSNPSLYDEIVSLDLNNQVGLEKFAKSYSDKISEYNSNLSIANNDGEEPIVCIPGVFFCVYYVVAGAVSYVVAVHSVVAAVNFVAVALVEVKVKIAPPNGGGGSTDKADLVYKEVYEYYRTK